MMKDMEAQYLKKNSRYNIERELLSTIKKEELQSIINDKSKEEKYHKDNLVRYMKKLASLSWYASLDDLEKQFFEWMIYVKAWGKELENSHKIIKDLKYLYNLKFTTKNVSKDKNYISRELIDQVKWLDISNVIFKYSWLEWNRNNMIKCPLHSDNKSSFKIYSETNSFNCFWCDWWWTTIEFTAKLFGLTNKEAIQKLKQDFIY